MFFFVNKFHSYPSSKLNYITCLVLTKYICDTIRHNPIIDLLYMLKSTTYMYNFIHNNYIKIQNTYICFIYSIVILFHSIQRLTVIDVWLSISSRS